MTSETYVILGATSGIATATARRLASKGTQLALVARNSDKLSHLKDDMIVRGANRVETYTIDLADVSQVSPLYDSIEESMSPIAGILVFYGVLGDQGEALHDMDHALNIVDVNFRSAAAWVLQGAIALEKSHAENRTLIGISSVAADRGRRSNFIYGSSKAGLSVLLQGLSHHWGNSRHQPRSVNFKLGFVDTPMTDGFDKSGPLWAQPDQIAARIERALTRGGPTIYAPWFWRWIMLAIRATPSFVFNRVNL